MKVEQQYYENPNLWKAEKYQTLQLTRAQITKQWLTSNVESVLDVGCGNGIITNILDQFAVGVDRSWATLGHVQTPHCQADAVHLPFANNSFDAVISTEVIEHLPHPIYKSVLAEIVRVSRKYILISVPYQEDLLSSQIMCPVCSCRFHPSFHMRTFDLRTMETLFADFSQVQMIKADGIMETTPYRSNHLKRRILNFITGDTQNVISFVNRLCPLCGYFGENEISHPRKIKTFSLENIIITFWPKKRSYRWWLALYSKL